MRLYLIRHFESIKNQRNALSSTADGEGLTELGRERCAAFSNAFSDALKAQSRVISKVLSSSSARGTETAEIISAKVGISEILPCDFLRSTDAGPFAGLSSEEVRKLNPEWHHAFALYEAGIFNQYEFDTRWPNIGTERKRDFERRVVDGFLSHLEQNTVHDMVVVANRSSLTALLIYFAREARTYPREFYGHVRLDLGSLSVVQKGRTGWEMIAVNSHSPQG